MNIINFTKYCILIVEDNEFVRKMIRKQVEMFGFENILEADEGYAAIEILKEHTPDVILCDISMEPLDGFDLLMHIRRMDEPKNMIPVIFLTSHGKKEYVEKAKDLYVDSYLLKPVQPKKLYNQIRKVLDIAS